MSDKIQRISIYGFPMFRNDPKGNFCDYHVANARYQELETAYRELQERHLELVKQLEQKVVDIST